MSSCSKVTNKNVLNRFEEAGEREDGNRAKDFKEIKIQMSRFSQLFNSFFSWQNQNIQHQKY